jgi:predicted secreted Zn-dependent protease
MLSSVPGSQRAIAVNIEIMRTFVRVRALAATHGDLAKRLAELEDKTEALAMNHDTFSRKTRSQLEQDFDAARSPFCTTSGSGLGARSCVLPGLKSSCPCPRG